MKRLISLRAQRDSDKQEEEKETEGMLIPKRTSRKVE
jgi:hypothetical protein